MARTGDEGGAGVDRSRGVNRLVSFTDAVVAIAATLLVLPLVELVPDHDVDDLGPILAENGAAFFAFGLSFGVVYRFWLVHHLVFRDVMELTGPLAWINGLWLLAIAFLPFPTQLVGSQDTRDRLTYGLYLGTLLVATACGAISQWLILRSRHRAGSLLRILAPALVVLGAMVLAFLLAVIGAGVWALLPLLPAALAQDRLIRRVSRTSADPS